jgi:transposase
MGIAKGKLPPRYDQSFKDGAVKLVVEQGRPSKAVAQELGICIDTLKNWLKTSGVHPTSVERDNRQAQRVRELESQVRELKKQSQEKDEVIAVLKKSVGILSTP